MPRPFSVRRPVLEVYAKASARIAARQARDEERAKIYREMMNEDDPKHQAILKELEERIDLTDKEHQTLQFAATVAAKLERVADKSEEDAEKVPVAKRAAALDALEKAGPKPPPAATPADEEPH